MSARKGLFQTSEFLNLRIEHVETGFREEGVVYRGGMGCRSP